MYICTFTCTHHKSNDTEGIDQLLSLSLIKELLGLNKQ